MGDERFISSASGTRENPRSYGFAQERLSPSISERFRAMLREREEDLRGCGDESPPPPDGNEIMRMYGELLTELTFNSKPIITELTIIAGDQREHARGISEAVCARIEEVPQDQKLPILYLLDSIVKNIGDDYVRTFATRLPKTFCQAYNDVHSSLHPAMRHLFQTWSQVFPHSTLSRIEEKLKFSAPVDQRLSGLASMRNSETSHSSHVIHVNPKYLEARRQFENDVTDIRHSREVSGHRSFTNYNDHDLDHLSFQPPNLRIVREGSSQSLTQHGSSMVGQEGPFLNSQRKVTTHKVSPARIGPRRSTSPQGQRFQMGSPGQAIEASSRSHSGLEFQSHRASESNSWFGRSLAMDDGIRQSAALPMYNRYGRQRQRELIDAYGNYRDKDFLHESFPKVQRVDVNGIKGKTGKMDWQNSEEEEYVWEDMSPTLANSSKKSSTLFEPSTENLALTGNSSRPGIISEKSDFRRRSWPVPPPLKDSTTTLDERIAIGDYGFGPTNKLYLDDTRSTIKQFRHHESSHRIQEQGSLPHAFHHSTPDNLSPKSHGRSFQLPYLVSGVRPITHKRHILYDNSHNAEAPFLKLTNALPNTPNLEMSTLATQKANQSLLAPSTWPPAHKSQPLQLLPTSNLQVDNNMPIGNQQSNFSVLLPQQPFDAGGRQLLRQAFQEPHGGFIPPVLPQPLSGVQPHGQSGVLDSILPNPIPGTSVQNMLDISLHGRSSLPPLPPGPPPLSSQPLTASQSNCSATSQSSVSGFSGLISSLMAQGLISLTASAQSQNTVGLEFNAELLKIRHESAIKSMYTDLPRQCSTCGLRFTCQEDHSNHMDWHVTKNRISKNRKQKPSRKWFVSAKEWLCGAETLGADAVPGFLPTDAAPEQREETEMAVPADENQMVCALCGEPFEDFYSDETDEWMYRGAVYLNAPHGDIEGLERSQLGPIVHVKCRPESTEGSGQV